MAAVILWRLNQSHLLSLGLAERPPSGSRHCAEPLLLTLLALLSEHLMMLSLQFSSFQSH